jgi:hypothetical protein
MTRLRSLFALTLVFAVLAVPISRLNASPTTAGQPSAPAAAVQAPGDAKNKPLVPLRVSVVIGRFQGTKLEKQTGNLPFTLTVNADGGRTSLNMASQVPIPQTVISDKGVPSTSVQYRNIGTQITSSAQTMGDGRFLLELTVSDNQIFTNPTTPNAPAPTLQSFSSSTALILRNGESTQFTTATDAATGEVIKVDVTLSVIK